MKSKKIEKLKVNEIIGIANFELVKGKVNINKIVESGYDEFYIDLEDLADKENSECFYLIDLINFNRIRGLFLGDELNANILMNVFDNLNVYLMDIFFIGAIEDYAPREDRAKLYEGSWEDLIKYFETNKTDIDQWSEWHLNVLRLIDNPSKHKDLVSQELN